MSLNFLVQFSKKVSGLEPNSHNLPHVRLSIEDSVRWDVWMYWTEWDVMSLVDFVFVLWLLTDSLFWGKFVGDVDEGRAR